MGGGRIGRRWRDEVRIGQVIIWSCRFGRAVGGVATRLRVSGGGRKG